MNDQSDDQFDLGSFALTLVREYLVIKERWKAGGRTSNIVEEMNDRERAGNLLKVSGQRALEAYDGMLALAARHGRTGDPHPGTRCLIVQALNREEPS